MALKRIRIIVLVSGHSFLLLVKFGAGVCSTGHENSAILQQCCGVPVSRDGHVSGHVKRPFCRIEISPDGTRLAAMRGPEGPIQILSLRGHPTRVIRAKNLQSLSWAADGNGLFVSQRMLTGMRILYVDLEGNEKVLWNNDRGNLDDENRARQSPDGKHLAIQDPNVTSNMWMMEYF